jgi:proteasome beta subunit
MESTYSKDASLEEIKAIAEKAVRAAMERDPGSGNGVLIVTIPLSGGQTVVSKGAN